MGKTGLEFQRAWNNLVDWWHYHLSSGDYKKMRDSSNYKQFREVADTDEEIGAAMNKITYQSENVDEWRDPFTTYERGNGDCDDSSGMSMDIDNHHHPPAKPELGRLLVACWGEEATGHATTWKPGKNLTICNWGRIYHDSTDVKKVVEFWYKPWVGIMTYYQKVTNPDSEHPTYEYVLVDSIEPTLEEIADMKQKAVAETKEEEEAAQGKSYLKVIGGMFAKLFTRKPELRELKGLVQKFVRTNKFKLPSTLGTFEDVVSKSYEHYNEKLKKLGYEPLEKMV